VIVHCQEEHEALGEPWSGTPFPAALAAQAEVPKCAGCAERDERIEALQTRLDGLMLDKEPADAEAPPELDGPDNATAPVRRHRKSPK
jgi:hypothetical protein